MPTITIAKKEVRSEVTFSRSELITTLLIAGLGFFVDVYDIVLFAVVRVSSLLGLGVSSAQSLTQGVLLLNVQMAGMIVGGLLWGILGDKKGRKSILFGSILLYSVANLLNGFVNSVPAYEILRFLAGVGLAGEVGAAMTIAAEITPRKYRAYGTSAVAGLGIAGAIMASYIGGILPWRMAFITAGIAGLVLLFARMSMKETTLFEKMHYTAVMKGSLKLLFGSKKRTFRLMRCVIAAIPLWFAIGILVSFAPEIVHNPGNIVFSVASIALSYSLGETMGEVVSGLISQLFRSRKIAMLIFLSGAFISAFAVLNSSPQMYGIFCFPLGFFVGYWSVVITSTAEQFGTNLRSTATTLVPNLVRASVIPMSFLFGLLSTIIGVTASAAFAGIICFLMAAVAIISMDETFGKDLDFLEV